MSTTVPIHKTAALTSSRPINTKRSNQNPDIKFCPV